MKQYDIKLEAGKYYHIYNKGINGTNIFFEERNYFYFLEKYAKYLWPVLDTYAYCLLGNHFHLLVKVKGDILNNLSESKFTQKQGLHSIDRIVSKKFSDFFNSYSKSVNKAQNRTGGLFETPFKRILVSNKTYFNQLVWYIHFNPQKHCFVKDFKEYPHSSFRSFLSNNISKLDRDTVIQSFNDIDNFKSFHSKNHNEKDFDEVIIEFDDIVF